MYVVTNHGSEVLHIPSGTDSRTECGRSSRSMLASHATPMPGYYRECVKCSQALSRKEES